MAALLRAGADVWVRGAGEASRGPAGARVYSRPQVGKFRRGLRSLWWPLRGRADVIVTIDPDTSVSAWLRPGRWVADVHEDYRELLRDRSWVPRPLLSLLRRSVSLLTGVIGRADLVLVADDHVPPVDAPNRYVMRNEPDDTVLPAMPTAPQGGERSYRAVYVGDNRTSRGLRTMIEAVAATVDDERPWTLDLIGPVARADRDWLAERLRLPDARLIAAHGRQPPAESWRIAGGADVGLCLLDDTPAFHDAMPSKVYEYLAMGLPTLATPLPRVRRLLESTGAGVIVRDAGEATAALRRFAGDDSGRDTLVLAARGAGAGLRALPSTYDEAAARILAVLS